MENGRPVTTGVDLLRGLGLLADMALLQIPGVTDGPDNDYAAQAVGGLESWQTVI